MDRRVFLKSSACAAALAALDFPAAEAKGKPRGKCRLKVGILVDVLVRHTHAEEKFIRALKYFRDNKVDAVMMAGDLIDNGLLDQYGTAVRAWYSVFPNDSYPDGTKVERLFLYGNHEIEGWRYKATVAQFEDEAYRKRNAIGFHKEKVWEDFWHEKWEPVYLKEIKGYVFIGAHYFDKWHVPGLEEFFERVKDRLPAGNKPFFYFQHPHPKGTCSAPWVWGQDNGKSTALLSKYPNVIALSGHSCTSITDERSIWQGAFTSVNCGALIYIVPTGGRENTEVYHAREKVPSQMKPIINFDAPQGMIMEVYDDRVLFRRHEFTFDEDLGTWDVPTDVSRRPYSFEYRRQHEKAPRFPAGAAVEVSAPKPGKDRYGTEQEQVTVYFPSAPSTQDSPRALDYEIQVEEAGVDVFLGVLTKRVFSERYVFGEKKEAEIPVRCVFSVNELPKDRPYRFAVRPCNAFGRKGEAIYSELFGELPVPIEYIKSL
ncbi:MAG: metallophosphoesterase [Bacteroidales bacterium]|nr:metallophosphoesterase [Bacteroidales bacterium]